MVGIIVGSGIFQTPTSIAKELGNPWLILGLWLLGGVISLCGALTWAELATMFPESGGIYVYLREGLGRCPAFVFGWTYMLITKPTAAAGIAVVFAKNINFLFHTQWDEAIVTCVVLIVLTIINTFHVELGGGFAIVLTSMKIAALVGIVVLAVFSGAGDSANFVASPVNKPLSASLIAVMSAILWTYDGWSDVGAIAGEVRNPQRELPRIFFMGTALVTLLYVLVNAVYFALVPLSGMREIETVAPLVAQRLLGAAGGIIVALVVLISTLGSTHGSILTGARYTFAQARDGLLFRPLGHIQPRFGTPDVSLWVQLVLSCLAVLCLRNFDRLINGFTFTMWIFYGLAGVTVIVLRWQRPQAERPYRCWGYPVVPLIFILAAAGMTTLSILNSFADRTAALRGIPDSLLWLAVLLTGVPIYFVWEHVTRLKRPKRE